MRFVFVIPHYDHLQQLRSLLPPLKTSGLPIIIVDDGSPGPVQSGLETLLAAEYPDIKLMILEQNQGKGAAVSCGLLAARDMGFTHAVQIDADGQHDPGRIAALLDAARARPGQIISGIPEFDDTAPGIRYYFRYLTLFLARVETLSKQIKDAMCGFRVYPLGPVSEVIERSQLNARMAFDPEILVRACWQGIGIDYVPVRVSYPEGGKSHFRYFRDNLHISWMHTRLLAGMLWRLPTLLRR